MRRQVLSLGQRLVLGHRVSGTACNGREAAPSWRALGAAVPPAQDMKERLHGERRLLHTTASFHTPQLDHSLSSPSSSANQQSQERLWNLSPKFERFFRRYRIFRDRDLRFLAARTASIGVYTGIASTMLGTLGVDMSPIIATISVSGLSIGFASRDIVSNYMAGLLLIATKPFETGDEIIIGKRSDNVRGIVSRIDLRYLHLKDVDSPETILIPNANVYKSTIHTLRKGMHLSEDDLITTGDGACHEKSKMALQRTHAVLRRAALRSSSYLDSLRENCSSSTRNDDADAERRYLQPMTPEFKRVVDLAFHELSALEERALRRRFEDVMFEIGDPTCQKVILWLASGDGEANVHRPEWQSFLHSISRRPAWVPQQYAVIPKQKAPVSSPSSSSSASDGDSESEGKS